jgi:hypothetical protein
MSSRNAMSRFITLMIAVLALAPLGWFARAHAAEFPFDHEMYLDANLQRGSKRLPGLQFAQNGETEIDLWCVTGKGYAVIAGESITIVPSAMRNNQCSAEQLQADEELLRKIVNATGWRRDGNIFTLVGPQTLRFRLATN